MKKKLCFVRGQRLRQARVNASLSQAQMATRLGCSRQLVGQLESGANLNADQLEKWCVACGCSSDVILFGAPAAESPCEDPLTRQFAALAPDLRNKLWVYYQVFLRNGAPDRAPHF
jgi:Predicted transcriptional regulators